MNPAHVGKRIMRIMDLPNTEGFKFYGITEQNKFVECKVARRDNGQHYIVGEATYGEIIAWVHA